MATFKTQALQGCADVNVCEVATQTQANFSVTVLAGKMLTTISTLVRAMRHRAEIRQMLRMDENALKDIGLARSDVSRALSQPLWNDPSPSLVGIRDRKRDAARWARSAFRHGA